MLDTSRKLLERLSKLRLIAAIQNSSRLSPQQYSFRSGRSSPIVALRGLCYYSWLWTNCFLQINSINELAGKMDLVDSHGIMNFKTLVFVVEIYLGVEAIFIWTIEKEILKLNYLEMKLKILIILVVLICRRWSQQRERKCPPHGGCDNFLYGEVRYIYPSTVEKNTTIIGA